MNTIQSVFNELGIPLASDKLVGPSPALMYLGIEIDSTSRSIRLQTYRVTSVIADMVKLQEMYQKRVAIIDRFLIICLQGI